MGRFGEIWLRVEDVEEAGGGRRKAEVEKGLDSERRARCGWRSGKRKSKSCRSITATRELAEGTGSTK